MKGIRYANIGIVVATAIILVGVLLFRNTSESAMQATALVGFMTGIVVYVVLDERAERRKGKRPQ